MAVLLREINCHWCGRLFWLCSACDRGHRYCGPNCRQLGRQRSLRRARLKYARSSQGRENNRARQRRHRLRRGSRVQDDRRKRNGSHFPATSGCGRLTVWPIARNPQAPPGVAGQSAPRSGEHDLSRASRALVEVSSLVQARWPAEGEQRCSLCDRPGGVLRQHRRWGRFRWNHPLPAGRAEGRAGVEKLVPEAS